MAIKPTGGCIQTGSGHSWLLVSRKAYRRDAPPQWFRFKKYATYEQEFSDYALATRDHYEALTSPFGTEVWRGLVCSGHMYNALEKTETGAGCRCAVLVWRLTPLLSHNLSLYLMLEALRDLSFYDEEILTVIRDKISMGKRKGDPRPLHDLVERKMIEAGTQSPLLPTLRLLHLFSLISWETKGENWRIRFSEFIAAVCAASPLVRRIVDKRAVSILFRDTPSKTKARVVLNLTYLLTRGHQLPKREFLQKSKTNG